MSDIKDELDALLIRIRSHETRRAGDLLFSADPYDLSATYSPESFERPDSQPDSKSIDINFKK